MADWPGLGSGRPPPPRSGHRRRANGFSFLPGRDGFQSIYILYRFHVIFQSGYHHSQPPWPPPGHRHRRRPFRTITGGRRALGSGRPDLIGQVQAGKIAAAASSASTARERRFGRHSTPIAVFRSQRLSVPGHGAGLRRNQTGHYAQRPANAGSGRDRAQRHNNIYCSRASSISRHWADHSRIGIRRQSLDRPCAFACPGHLDHRHIALSPLVSFIASFRDLLPLIQAAALGPRHSAGPPLLHGLACQAITARPALSLAGPSSPARPAWDPPGPPPPRSPHGRLGHYQ